MRSYSIEDLLVGQYYRPTSFARKYQGGEINFAEKRDDVWVAIRDVAQDENNPKSAQQILSELSQEPFFSQNTDKILLSIIPDIESVNYGRGVGYEVVYHEPPTEVAAISGTKIRNGEIDNAGNKTETHS